MRTPLCPVHLTHSHKHPGAILIIVEEMETAIGAASWLVGKVLNKLSDKLVAEYVASSELGRNSEQIKNKMKHMQGLLHLAQERDVSDNPGLQSLLEDLSKKADEAEDALDELHYFMIQDRLDGTEEAAPEVGDGLRGHAFHGRHAVCHAIGNWFPCFSCLRTQDADDDCVAALVTSNPPSATNFDSGNGGGYVEKLTFDRVAMSNKIKSVIEGVHNLCDPVSDLLNKIPSNSTTVTIKRPPTGSTQAQDKLYGRTVIFEQTVNVLTGGTYHSRTLSVLPFVGPGGMGKTTFTQHLYNDTRIEEYFTARIWVCVSTDFDVHKLTWQILNCIPVTEKEDNNTTNETSSLDQLQKSIAQRLKSKRFLVVLDDIWKCNSEGDWKNLLAPFKKGETKGNMVLVTTRFPYIAEMVKTIDPVELHGLEPNDFFTLFEACIFGENKPVHYEDDLIDVGRDIARKLKGSPLAANTIGRLLRKKNSREYWMGVLEKKEWQNSKNDDDIMPSLKISYDYLPFHLKKCFSYCALFPEDYRFYNLDFMRFLIAIGIVDSTCQNDKNYLEELADSCFLIKGDDNFGEYYVMHDLLHELSLNVSSQECVNISSLCFRADDIPKSIRHLSITIENKYHETFGEAMDKVKSMIDIRNLRSLMIFGLHDARISNILKITFEAIKGLRVLFIAMNTLESLPKSFSNLIHLQYLQIRSPYGLEMTLPSTLSRFYHLKFLDLESWYGSQKLPKDISRLVNLRHLSSSKELHSNIPEVGKMKCFQELKEFHVKKESVGFELRELGELSELGGELSIRNLENVASKGEASDAKLKNKKNLKVLRLVWGTEHRTIDDDVLDGLEPPPNLRKLGIINPGVAAGPNWLYGDISTKRLESLHLEGVSWGTLPPFEQLSHLAILILKNIGGMRVFGPGFGGVTERSFMHLKKIVFEDMPELVEWVGEPNSHLLSRLESIKIQDCPFLCSFPFLEYSAGFTNLLALTIVDCPELSQLPPMPHTCALTNIHVRSGEYSYSYDGNRCGLHGYNIDLVFQNMAKVESLHLEGVSWGTLPPFEQLPHLTELILKNIGGMRVFGPGFGGVTERSFMHLKKIVFEDMPELVEWVGEPNSHLFSRLERINIQNCPFLCSFPFLEYSASFTNLFALDIEGCPKLSRFPPMPHTCTLTDVHVRNGESSYSYDGNRCGLHGYNIDLAFQNMDKVEIMSIEDLSPISLSDLQKLKSVKQLSVRRCDSVFAELDNNLVLSSVQRLDLKELCITGESFSKVLKCFPALSQIRICNCSSLDLLPMEDGGGLWDLTMLQSFESCSCDKLFSGWPMGEVGGAHTIKPFPASLRKLVIESEKSSINSWALLSNLTSLTSLCLVCGEKIAMDGLNPLIAVNLKTLTLSYDSSCNEQNIPLAVDVLPEMAKSKLMHTGAFQLEELTVDSISAVLVAPISSHLAATLHRLYFSDDLWMESFTEEQEQALQLLTSLHHLGFNWCRGLRSLPRGLHRLASLRELNIVDCPEITSLPEAGLPALLQTLEVWCCSAQLREEAQKLEGTNPCLSNP